MQITNLTVAFKTEKQLLTAVDDLNFTLQPGETLALLGESGCGKSITALSLIRLLPHTAVYGSASKVNLDAEDLLNLPEFLMRQLRGRRLSMIFQEPMTALNPVLRVGDQLAEAVRLCGQTSQLPLQERLITLLQEVEMSEPELRLRQYPHQLSGGQKQRIIIAMALANNPEILIADEPTTALDVTVQAQILKLLRRLQNRHQMRMLLITHDLGVVKAVADRICVMYAGQLVEEALVSDFFQQVKHPYSQQLLASLPTYDKRHFHLQAITGAVPSMDDLPLGCRFHPRCAHAFAECHTKMPLLQNLQHRSVRCHLYPEHEKPPALVENQCAWNVQKPSTEVLLSAQNLCVHYYASGGFLNAKLPVIKAVDSLSFHLRRGETLALVGESVCGKTTVARALLHLLPITSGHIIYRDSHVENMNRAALREYRNRVQIIFQDPFSSMNPRMTISEIIAEGMLAQNLSSTVIQQRQIKLLDQVNLPKNCLQRYPHQFSGGQRQRICLARALATEPEILICDEPTSALDVSVQAQILNLLQELQVETQISYLFITHNMAVVSYMAHEVMVMKQGRVVEAGSCEALLAAPREAYTRELLSSILF